MSEATKDEKHVTSATVSGEDIELVVEPADIGEMYSLHDPTSVVVIEVVEPHDVLMTNQSTLKGKAVEEATEAVHAWAEDSVPEVVPYKIKKPWAKKTVAAKPPEPKVEIRSWSETFTVIGKYGAIAALVALVGLMFLNDHLPRRTGEQQAVTAPATTTMPWPMPHLFDDDPATPTQSAPPTVTPEAAPPPVTVTKEPPPAPPPPKEYADVNAATLDEYDGLLGAHGMHRTDSDAQIAQEAQVNCHAAANGDLSYAINLTDQKNGAHLPPGGAAQIIHGTITAFCPQYG